MCQMRSGGPKSDSQRLGLAPVEEAALSQRLEVGL